MPRAATLPEPPPQAEPAVLFAELAANAPAALAEDLEARVARLEQAEARLATTPPAEYLGGLEAFIRDSRFVVNALGLARSALAATADPEAAVEEPPPEGVEADTLDLLAEAAGAPELARLATSARMNLPRLKDRLRQTRATLAQNLASYSTAEPHARERAAGWVAVNLRKAADMEARAASQEAALASLAADLPSLAADALADSPRIVAGLWEVRKLAGGPRANGGVRELAARLAELDERIETLTDAPGPLAEEAKAARKVVEKELKAARAAAAETLRAECQSLVSAAAGGDLDALVEIHGEATRTPGAFRAGLAREITSAVLGAMRGHASAFLAVLSATPRHWN